MEKELEDDMISKFDILYLADKQFKEAKEKWEKEKSLKTADEYLMASKRLDDAVLYYEGKLEFKAPRKG